jgi:hypothetical protein
VSSYLALYVNAKLDGKALGKKLSASYVAGYIFSFSKSSFTLIVAFVIMRFRRLVDYVPLFLLGGVFLFCLVIFWHRFELLLMLPHNITYLGRFGGYALLYELNLHQLFFGISSMQNVSGSFAQFIYNVSVSRGATLGRLGGVGGWCVYNGIFSFLLYMIGLQALGIRGGGFFLVLLMTSTVGPDTNQNFVLLSYYTAFMLSRLPRESALRKRKFQALRRPMRFNMAPLRVRTSQA